MAVGAVTALTGALGVISVDWFVPLPYVTGLAWTGVFSIMMAVRPSLAATGAASEGVPGPADVAGRV